VARNHLAHGHGACPTARKDGSKGKSAGVRAILAAISSASICSCLHLAARLPQEPAKEAIIARVLSIATSSSPATIACALAGTLGAHFQRLAVLGVCHPVEHARQQSAHRRIRARAGRTAGRGHLLPAESATSATAPNPSI